MHPAPEVIRGQLERVLASETFQTAGRHSRLLRYVVERTLAGEGDQLKEYMLGAEVFDRSDTYDPRLDSIVRVEARRLRQRLDDYYAGPGSDDPVTITIPRGSYVPVFTAREAALPAVAMAPGKVAARPSDPPQWLRLPAGAAGLAVVILMVVALATALRPGATTSVAQAALGPGIAVLPFEPYSTDDGDVLLAARITDAVTTELARAGTVSVASRLSASRFAGDRPSAGEVADALNVAFLMEGSAVQQGGRTRVLARLVDAARDRKVWVGEYDLTPAEVPAVSRTIAVEAAAAAVAFMRQATPER